MGAANGINVVVCQTVSCSVVKEKGVKEKGVKEKGVKEKGVKKLTLRYRQHRFGLLNHVMHFGQNKMHCHDDDVYLMLLLYPFACFLSSAQ